MNVALYGKSLNSYNLQPIKNAINKLEQLGATLHINTELYELIKPQVSFSSILSIYESNTSLKNKADLLISIGGDGTILNALPLIKNTKIPIVGINTGRLGFLATINIEEIENAISLIAEGKGMVEERTLLSLESEFDFFGENNFALNEFTLRANGNSAMITIHVFNNGTLLNTYWADGLIISTPTGSTAYSMSCGGPIVMPDSENFVITPIAPHNLNVRPLIISDKDIITVKAVGRNKKFLVTLDSRSEVIDPEIELTVKKERFTASIIRLPHHDFPSTLREKLLWGLDFRNQ
jgi:NAD+ kinase